MSNIYYFYGTDFYLLILLMKFFKDSVDVLVIFNSGYWFWYDFRYGVGGEMVGDMNVGFSYNLLLL